MQFAILAMALVLSACGGAPGPDERATLIDEVRIATFRFRPQVIEVQTGTAVRWSNQDRILHTATAGTPEAPSGAFDVRMDGAGTSGEVTFDEPGTYPYFCARHPHMRGEVRVAPNA
ncbi:MAG: cupredoxin domain-containing protein [Acidimicrobiia bacterium]